MNGGASRKVGNAGRRASASARSRPSGARCTGSSRPRASAATGSSPIGCWPWETRFQLEKISYRAWQQQFGRSVSRSAPGMFVSRLARLAASAGGQVVELNTRRAKLSQRCHCGAVVKKPLRQRWHGCACGVSAQRDLFSAHLARFVNPDTSVLKARQAASAWRRGEPLVQAAYQHAIANQRASGRHPLSSFGQPPVDPSETRVACDRSASQC